MGDLQHFCLRWNNYQNSITTAFENLRDDEDFIDVTLACDGKSLKAHRVVLSACSPYFRELLKSTPCKHPVIVLQDVVFDDLQALVEFIYHGEVNVHQRNLSSFLKTAEVLRVSGLTQPTDSSANDQHAARQSSETPPAENAFLSLATQVSEGRVSPQVRQRKGQFPQQSPSSIPSPRSKENSPIPLKRNKILTNPSPGGLIGGGCIGGGGGGCMDLSERSSQHSPSSAGSRPNCNDDDDAGDKSDGGGSSGCIGIGGNFPMSGIGCIGSGNGTNGHHLIDEPPMDYSRTHHQHQQQPTAAHLQQDTAQNLMVSSRKSPADVKSEPMDATSATAVNSGSAYGADDSNDSAADFTGVHPAIGMSEPDDTSYQSHHSYLDSKFYAAAGATLNFNIAAAMADSLAGLNNHNHINVMETLGGSSSQGLKKVFPCLACGKVLCSKASLKRHVADKHASRQEEYRCAICERVYCSRNSLMTHIYTYHKTRPTMLLPPPPHHAPPPPTTHSDIKF
ncbi:BTB/POZ domain,Zinc finger C2H2-type,SKP1/BTB/POZ domain,Zinc finger, RING/FYVE/PHD-type [Cinara cedri]|uniref:BTB/POZ domain,Zinc finger C2H2-type,SKP1/BTB/POZ domain,Zinc finger, RING/FYVE/PHD-type n=1 Tax=Cinara cedri TaxID=506608 RepID=A0A5E4NKA8_9HEMI|nr:BTB/POZ domain,Zinc finger C2H2-type,SKP1/BTB/POZ domain,Zinc finger, RING/FYVE/PHD-type [Cinara cedri]